MMGSVILLVSLALLLIPPICYTAELWWNYWFPAK